VRFEDAGWLVIAVTERSDRVEKNGKLGTKEETRPPESKHGCAIK
jgi:hypothetical protein